MSLPEQRLSWWLLEAAPALTEELLGILRRDASPYTPKIVARCGKLAT